MSGCGKKNHRNVKFLSRHKLLVQKCIVMQGHTVVHGAKRRAKKNTGKMNNISQVYSYLGRSVSRSGKFTKYVDDSK